MACAKLLLETDTYARNIGGTLRDPLLIPDRDLCIKSATRAFGSTFSPPASPTASAKLSPTPAPSPINSSGLTGISTK